MLPLQPLSISTRAFLSCSCARPLFRARPLRLLSLPTRLVLLTPAFMLLREGEDALWALSAAGLKVKPCSRPVSPCNGARVLALCAWFSTDPGLSFSCSQTESHFSKSSQWVQNSIVKTLALSGCLQSCFCKVFAAACRCPKCGHPATAATIRRV